MEKRAPRGSNKEKNDDGVTPAEKFDEIHKDEKEAAKEWTKTIAESYSVIAVLIMTITFAALVTVLGEIARAVRCHE